MSAHTVMPPITVRTEYRAAVFLEVDMREDVWQVVVHPDISTAQVAQACQELDRESLRGKEILHTWLVVMAGVSSPAAR